MWPAINGTTYLTFAINIHFVFQFTVFVLEFVVIRFLLIQCLLKSDYSATQENYNGYIP